MTKQVIKTIRNFVLVRFWAKEKETLTNLCEHFLKFQCIYRKFVQSCICIIGRKFYGKVGFWSEKSVSAEGVWRNDFINQAYTFLHFDQKYTYSKYDSIWRKLSGVAVRGVTYCLPEGRQTRLFLAPQPMKQDTLSEPYRTFWPFLNELRNLMRVRQNNLLYILLMI